MSKLLALSFDAPSSPAITLLYTRAERMVRERPFGWGMGWYAPNECASVVVKDPTAAGDNATSELLRDWTRFCSTIFICHLRGAASRISQENTHPFSRSYAGRDWLITHHGHLRPGFEQSMSLGDDPLFEPMGRTDTEHILCWLLTRCRGIGARTLADVGWQQLHGWLSEVNQMGSLDLLLSDGTDLVAYQDANGYDPIQMLRVLPPQVGAPLTSDDVELDMANARDRHRTGVLLATDPLTSPDLDAPWVSLANGQMLVLRRGAELWSSHPQNVALPARWRIAADAPVADPVGPEDPPAVPSTAGDWVSTSSAVPAQEQGQADGMLTDGDSAATRVYDVIHSTSYRYGTPVERSRHALRLRPVQDRNQDLLSFGIEISPHGEHEEFEDVFGNHAITLELTRKFSEFTVTARSRVRVRANDQQNLQSPLSRTTIPLSWMPWQRQMMTPYLLPPEIAETQLQELFDYAMSFVERQDYDLVGTLLDMNSSIYRDYEYVQGVTELGTTPFDVYASRRGVCQDFANLLICLARLLGVPARYRVGYIHTGANYENKLQSEASHAWAELYLPWSGWQGLDPTNGCVVNADHIRVACGRNYRDATPTAGTIYEGGGREVLTTEVRVELVPDPGTIA